MKYCCNYYASVFVIAALFFAGQASAQTLDTPTISCAGSLEASINIKICAGNSGAPGGFSLQWMTCADYAANGNQWYASDDPRLCKASFSGNANGSRYNLLANECVTVTVGDFLFDNGASTNCADALDCSECYVFRAFAHAVSKKKRSSFTGNLVCTTSDCGECCGSRGQGYWRNNSTVTAAVIAGMEGGCLKIGNTCYTAAQVQSILATPGAGNGLLPLAHQMIAVELSLAAFGGSCQNEDVLTCLSAAHTLVGNLVVPPVGAGSLHPSLTGSLTACLDAWIQAHDCGENPTP